LVGRACFFAMVKLFATRYPILSEVTNAFKFFTIQVSAYGKNEICSV